MIKYLKYAILIAITFSFEWGVSSKKGEAYEYFMKGNCHRKLQGY